MKIDHQLFRTGIPVIDRQHEAYLELVERVFKLCTAAQVERRVLATELDNTLAYAIEHFDTEEHLMRSARYPLYQEHLAKHDVFRAQVDTFAADLNAGAATADFVLRLTKWLVDWFCDQVQTDDMRLAAFLKKAPAERTP
jgi:hemerythrin